MRGHNAVIDGREQRRNETKERERERIEKVLFKIRKI